MGNPSRSLGVRAVHCGPPVVRYAHEPLAWVFSYGRAASRNLVHVTNAVTPTRKQKLKKITAMKNIITSSLRVAALASTLFLASSAVAADRAADMLAATGSVKIESVGPYVSTGTYRVQVSAKLGHPTTTLSDGTWIYENFNANDSSASGALVVRFSAERVSSITMVTPAVVVALRAQPKASDHKVLVAAWNQR